MFTRKSETLVISGLIESSKQEMLIVKTIKKMTTESQNWLERGSLS